VSDSAKPRPQGNESQSHSRAAAAVKAKPPAPEDKPFAEFHPPALPAALTKEIKSYGGRMWKLSFLEGPPLPVVGPAFFPVGRCSAFSAVAGASGCASPPPRFGSAKGPSPGESGS